MRQLLSLLVLGTSLVGLAACTSNGTGSGFLPQHQTAAHVRTPQEVNEPHP
ncbi:MAG: hypothetical protein ABI202_02695 [Candidatus Baltobacteraceae bacterium]